MLSPLVAAEVSTSIAEISSAFHLHCRRIVVSGSAEPGEETEGRVCDPTAMMGDETLRLAFVSWGIVLLFRLTPMNRIGSAFVWNYLDLRFNLDYHCRFWFETEDDNTVSVSARRITCTGKSPFVSSH